MNGSSDALAGTYGSTRAGGTEKGPRPESSADVVTRSFEAALDALEQERSRLGRCVQATQDAVDDARVCLFDLMRDDSEGADPTSQLARSMRGSSRKRLLTTLVWAVPPWNLCGSR